MKKITSFFLLLPHIIIVLSKNKLHSCFFYANKYTGTQSVLYKRRQKRLFVVLIFITSASIKFGEDVYYLKHTLRSIVKNHLKVFMIKHEKLQV